MPPRIEEALLSVIWSREGDGRHTFDFFVVGTNCDLLLFAPDQFNTQFRFAADAGALLLEQSVYGPQSEGPNSPDETRYVRFRWDGASFRLTSETTRSCLDEAERFSEALCP